MATSEVERLRNEISLLRLQMLSGFMLVAIILFGMQLAHFNTGSKAVNFGVLCATFGVQLRFLRLSQLAENAMRENDSRPTGNPSNDSPALPS